MKPSTCVLSLVVALSLTACSGPGVPRSSSPGSAPSAPPSSAPVRAASPHPSLPAVSGPASPEQGAGGSPPGAPPVVAGLSDNGDLVLFDSMTGAVLSRTAGAGLGGEVDVAADPWHGRLLTFEADDEDQWGEIAGVPVNETASGPELGERVHEVWVDGVARVAPSPFGAVEVEDGGYGPRYKLLSVSGAPLPSVAAPRPASIHLAATPGGVELSALTYGMEGDALDLRGFAVSAGGVTPLWIEPLPMMPVADWPSARWIRSGEGEIMASARSGDIVISTRSSGPWSAPALLGVGAEVERVEHAVALPGRRAALLVSGEVDLVVVSLDVDGAILCADAIDLPGAPRRSPLFFSRGLLAAGGARLLAATSSGVFALSVGADCPPSLTVDPTFDGDALRGPLDAWGPLPTVSDR